MRSVALMISGPIPSPSATAIGIFFVIKPLLQNWRSSDFLQVSIESKEMFEELLSNLHSYLNHFFKEISIVHAEKILHALASCKGMIFLTGAGKSGHIAQKIAATLTSTGTKATYLCPNHAVHGDLGLVSAQDLVLIFSKSGETEELLYLLAALRKRGAFTIAIVSTQGSRLAKEADLSIQLPVQREICPYDLAPTTSTIVQLIFGDCLAIAENKLDNCRRCGSKIIGTNFALNRELDRKICFF